MAVAISGLLLTQSGTDTTLEVFNTAITAIPLVARNTAYSVNTVIKPPTANGFFYRCSVAGTTSMLDVVYTPTVGASVVDGTATFVAILASTKQIVGSKMIYRINSFQVIIAGTLTYDAKLEALELTDCTSSPIFRLNSGSNLTINSLINSKPSYEEALAIRPLTNAVNTEFIVDAGSTFNLNGGKIVVSGFGGSNYQSIYWNKGATINITDGWIKSSKNQSRIGESGSGNILGFNINRLIVEKIGFTIFGVLGNLQGLSPLSSSVQLVSYGAFTTLTLKDFNPIDTGASVDNWDIQNVFLDNAISSNINILGGNASANANRWITMRKDLTVRIENTSKVAIQNGVSYIKDTNNGSRLEVLGIVGQLNNNVYIQSTLATGLTAQFKVYTLHGKSNTNVSTATLRDYRSKTTVAGADLFDIYTFAYGSVSKLLSDTALNGNGSLLAIATLLADTSVTLTETNAIAKLASSFTVVGNVLTVTANSTLDDVYDIMKVYKTRPIQAQLEYPTIDTQPVNEDGTNLVTAMTIVVNAGVILSGGTKFKSITSGSVTITGNALSNITVNSAVTQSTPTNLTNVTITGTLTYNTATATPITYTNSTLATVSNAGAGIVTVKRINATLTAGTNVVSFVPTTLTFTLNGGRIRVLDNLGVEQYNTTTDATFELPANANGTWNYRIAKYGSQVIEGNFTIDGTTKAIIPSYIPDTFVVDTLANILAYTTLETSQKIYDYYAYFLGTALGIATTKALTLTASILNTGTYKISNTTLGVSGLVIGTNSATLAGVNIITNLVTGIIPTYPQQLTDSTGTTNWLKVTLTAGQVIQDTFNNSFKTASYTTLIPASFTSAITLYITQRGYKKQIITVPYSNSLFTEKSFTLIPDANVVDVTTDLTTVNLSNAQIIYDAFSQYQALANGILDTYTITKSPSAIDFTNKGFQLTTATDFTVLPLKLKSTALITDTYYSAQNFIQATASLSNDVKIRALNFDSEIIYNADSLTFYPTLTDRDAGTNAGVTTTGGVYRYKFGAIYSGVTMTNPLNIRYLLGSNVSLSSLAIVTGNFVFSLNNTELILLANSNLQKVNRNLLKESLLTPIFLKETF